MTMYMPDDVLEELVVRLPLKSLVKFKSVSKEWKSILESKTFVESHLSLQKSSKFLAAFNCDCGVSPSLLSGSRFEEGEEFVSLHCDATRPSMSCDGLVCIPEAGWINVLNPSTRQLRRFHSGPDPQPSRRSNCRPKNGTWSIYFPGNCAMGFGRDSVKGSYKVLRIFAGCDHCEILDVNTGEWSKLMKPRRYKVDVGRKSASVNGSIYWLRVLPCGVSGSVYTILALDLHTEEFHYINLAPLPKGIVFEAQIVNFGDRLAIAMPETNALGEWELEIWTMDAQQETWSKTHSIGLSSLFLNQPVTSRSFTPVTLSKQGNLVFYDDKKRLFKYYPEIDELRPLSSDICLISPYLENLVPLHQTQQLQLRTGITCIRRTMDAIQSRDYEFLCKGIIDIGSWLWKNKTKLLITYLLARVLCCCFGMYIIKMTLRKIKKNLCVPVGLVTRENTKRINDALYGLIYEVWYNENIQTFIQVQHQVQHQVQLILNMLQVQ